MIDPLEPAYHHKPERLLDLGLNGVPTVDQPSVLLVVTILAVLLLAAMIAFLPRLRWRAARSSVPAGCRSGS